MKTKLIVSTQVGIEEKVQKFLDEEEVLRIINMSFAIEPTDHGPVYNVLIIYEKKEEYVPGFTYF